MSLTPDDYQRGYNDGVETASKPQSRVTFQNCACQYDENKDVFTGMCRAHRDFINTETESLRTELAQAKETIESDNKAFNEIVDAAIRDRDYFMDELEKAKATIEGLREALDWGYAMVTERHHYTEFDKMRIKGMMKEALNSSGGGGDE